MIGTKNVRAYIKLVDNKRARTSASKQYFQVFAENGDAMLFTTNDMEKAMARASKNPEDVYAVSFVEPEPQIVEKEVVRVVEVSKPCLFSRFKSLFKQ